jgi:hypothetical protein
MAAVIYGTKNTQTLRRNGAVQNTVFGKGGGGGVIAPPGGSHAANFFVGPGGVASPPTVRQSPPGYNRPATGGLLFELPDILEDFTFNAMQARHTKRMKGPPGP